MLITTDLKGAAIAPPPKAMRTTIITLIITLTLALAAGCATVNGTHEELAGQFDLAKRECAEAGGLWVTYIHADGWDNWVDSMRCLAERPPAHDPGWCEPLLPYHVTVEYDRRTKMIIEFTRTTDVGKIFGCVPST